MRSVLPVISPAQMREIDRLLVQTYRINPLQTLEHVGLSLAHLAGRLLDDDLYDRSIVVLAGQGVNGGGGLAAARHLLNRGAWVQILIAHPVEELAGAAARQLETLLCMEASLAWAEEGWELPPCDLVIDAVVGGGLDGNPEGGVRDLIELANSSQAPVLSLEAPSGIDAGSGRLYSPHVRAAATLALALPKAGLLQPEALAACGDLYLADIGVPTSLYASLGLPVPALFARDPVMRLYVQAGQIAA